MRGARRIVCVAVGRVVCAAKGEVVGVAGGGIVEVVVGCAGVGGGVQLDGL